MITADELASDYVKWFNDLANDPINIALLNQAYEHIDQLILKAKNDKRMDIYFKPWDINASGLAYKPWNTIIIKKYEAKGFRVSIDNRGFTISWKHLILEKLNIKDFL